MIRLYQVLFVTKFVFHYSRLCLQYGIEPSQGIKSYSGMADALRTIYRTEGLRGLYKGFVPGMFGVSHGALQFMTYEEMKNSYNQYRKLPIDTKLVCTSISVRGLRC